MNAINKHGRLEMSQSYNDLLNFCNELSLDVYHENLIRSICYFLKFSDKETPECTASNATLAKRAKMSVRHLQRCKKVLSTPRVDCGNKPIIRIIPQFDPQLGQITNIIQLSDLSAEIEAFLHRETQAAHHRIATPRNRFDFKQKFKGGGDQTTHNVQVFRKKEKETFKEKESCRVSTAGLEVASVDAPKPVVVLSSLEKELRRSLPKEKIPEALAIVSTFAPSKLKYIKNIAAYVTHVMKKGVSISSFCSGEFSVEEMGSTKKPFFDGMSVQEIAAKFMEYAQPIKPDCVTMDLSPTVFWVQTPGADPSRCYQQISLDSSKVGFIEDLHPLALKFQLATALDKLKLLHLNL